MLTMMTADDTGEKSVNDGNETKRPAESHQYLVLEEVADVCRTSLSTVRFWVRTGRLPSYRPGRRRLVRRDDMTAFIAAGRPNGPRAT
jgi:excisionase family DNA binding protein